MHWYNTLRSTRGWRLSKENVSLGKGEVQFASAGLPTCRGLLLLSISDSLDSDPLVEEPSFMWTRPTCLAPTGLGGLSPGPALDLPATDSPLAAMRRSRAAVSSARDGAGEDVPGFGSVSER
ncbi:hypothetical protein EYF80_035293 [Liparis tanakae]|uniref:Uncharacterized protein n=1 Tax=Liparis tanakae TaxID=230148 RepID=A0A4Z2GLN7_9TELE|nr:hypothetical protein EYF80_035293 [Liparis tanakae]